MNGPGQETTSAKATPSPEEHPKAVCMISHSRVSRDARVCRSARALAGKGHPVTLIALSAKGEPEAATDLRGVELRTVPDLLEYRQRFCRWRHSLHRDPQAALLRRAAAWAAAPFVFAGTARITRSLFFWVLSLCLLLATQADIVHCHDLNVLPLGWLKKALRRSSWLVYDSHEIFTEKVGLRNRRLWRAAERAMIAYCDRVIVTTELRAKALQAIHPGLDRIAVLHNYPEKYHGPTRDIRRGMLAESAFVALYQGGVQAERGLEELAEAAKLLVDAEDVFIVIQGDGPLLGKLQALAEEPVRAGRLKVLSGGPHRYLRQFTASANVGLQVLQSAGINHTTALSNKLFEYAQAGLPVIASDLPLIRKTLCQYGFGILVDAAQPSSIVEGLLRLRHDERLRQELARKAREAAQVLCWERERENLLAMYRSY